MGSTLAHIDRLQVAIEPLKQKRFYVQQFNSALKGESFTLEPTLAATRPSEKSEHGTSLLTQMANVVPLHRKESAKQQVPILEKSRDPSLVIPKNTVVGKGPTRDRFSRLEIDCSIFVDAVDFRCDVNETVLR